MAKLYLQTMGWFKRRSKGINTSTEEKKETPEGIWFLCPKCKAKTPRVEHAENLCTCKSCNFHERISPKEYFDILFDTNRYKRHFENILPVDSLQFEDSKPYPVRIEAANKKSGENEALQVAVGRMGGERVCIAAMNFAYIGGSMGTVVGEKIARAVDFCIENKVPLIIISKSGGARMMESGYSLMQMVKTSGKLARLAEAKLPYISLLTDPTTGGVSASYAMLGDVNIAEPGALIGFAGPRVIEETIKKKLPEGFQRSEFLLEHGFLDKIVDRKELKETITKLLALFKN